jgi:two-component system chemotaxis response regulator CheB
MAAGRPSTRDAPMRDIATERVSPGDWRHLVAVGGSAGAHEALRTVCAHLPAEFAAPVLVTVHMPPAGPSTLSRILDRAGPLTARTAEHGEKLVAGRIYVAPPDRHLRASRLGHVQLTRDSRVSRHRPAIDPLYTSVAEAAGSGAIAVLLSGGGGDGTDGARSVARRGGVVIVQDPAEARHPGMPRHALRFDHPHLVLAARAIADVLHEMVDEAREAHAIPPSRRLAVEATLWSAVRLFENRAQLCSHLAAQSRASGFPLNASTFEARAREARDEAASLRQALEEHELWADVTAGRQTDDATHGPAPAETA